MPAKYKATFRSLLPEIRSIIKMNRKDRWTDATLVHNIAAIVVWRIMDRDKKQNDTIRRLKRTVRDLL